MSLLLDALKRAEQEKLARGDRPDLQIVPEAPPAPSSAPPPAPSSAPPPGQRAAPPPGQRDRDAASAAAAHRASLELQPIAAPGAPSVAAPRPAASPAAAQAVFQAKLPPAGAKGKPRSGWIFAAAGVIAIAVIVACGYVWYVMQQLAPASVPGRRMAGPLAAPPPGSQQSVPQLSTPGFPQSGGAASFQVPVAEAGTPPPAPATVTTATSPPVAGPKAPAGPPTREQTAAELLRQSPTQRDPPVVLDRAPPQGPRISAQVSTGYEALRTSDLGGARRAYEAALTADAINVDAVLGLATVEARTGNIAAAAAGYRRALELDPRNPTALAGLATLADPSRRGTVEARLREDVMRYPQSPALHFALGNVYSSQSRWSEAQGEYFEAHRLDPSNADIAHNLAVALDNLGQPRVAAQFYRRALDAARTQPSQFDPAPVARRLAELGD